VLRVQFAHERAWKPRGASNENAVKGSDRSMWTELYDLHAEECARAAERTDNPRYRALLVKCAAEWREAAQALRQSPQPNADGARDRAASAQAPGAPRDNPSSCRRREPSC
jgi:hypothetical protein